MPRVVESSVELVVNGAAAYSRGGKFQIPFNNVSPLAGGNPTSIVGILLNLTVGMAHGNVAPVTLPEEIAFRILDRLDLRVPKGHVFLDLAEQAGWVLRCLRWPMEGRRPQSQGDVSLTNGVTTTFRVPIYVPFMLKDGIEPDDVNVQLEALKNSQLEGQWCDGGDPAGGGGGIFDTGADNEHIVSATLEASIDLISRDELMRGNPYFSIVSQKLNGLNERLPITDKVLHFLVEWPLLADNSLAVNRITAAERDRFKFVVDGFVWVDNEKVSRLNRRWTDVHSNARAEDLPHHEGNASPHVVLFQPHRNPYKISQLPAPMKDPQTRFTGTDATPRVVWYTTALHNEARVIDAINTVLGDDKPEGFDQAPAAFISNKTASKADPVYNRDGAQRLPFKVHRKVLQA